MPAGRPTEYDPAFCDAVIEMGKAGKSKVQMASHFEVCRNTLDNWAKQHPEFLSALTRAMTHAQDWWETQGQIGITADKFNGNVWSRSMAARFPEDWREVSRQEQTGRDGGPIEVKTIERRIVRTGH